MKPIIFVRIADMYYYKGITENDTPSNGGNYVKETGNAHECYNFDAAEYEDGEILCLGYAQLLGGSSCKDPELHIEKIVGCEGFRKEEEVNGVTVVWCSKSNQSRYMRVVGFYKNATVYRNTQVQEFENGYEQCYNFIANKEDCVLLPYQERHSNGNWYVPLSHQNGSSFGFGRSSLWYAGSNTDDENEIKYVERMLKNIETYSGENWINKGGDE